MNLGSIDRITRCSCRSGGVRSKPCPYVILMTGRLGSVLVTDLDADGSGETLMKVHQVVLDSLWDAIGVRGI